MITTPSKWLESDERFKRWAKKVSSKSIDLTKSNGFCLNGEWVRWGDQVCLESGEYLVVAAETGSRANHSYDYRLVCPDGEFLKEGESDRIISQCSDSERVKAHNNILYCYGLYIVKKSEEEEKNQEKQVNEALAETTLVE